MCQVYMRWIMQTFVDLLLQFPHVRALKKMLKESLFFCSSIKKWNSIFPESNENRNCYELIVFIGKCFLNWTMRGQ